MGRQALQRSTFRTSRLLDYFSEKELTLQTGHEPERWPEVVVKELVDNALDACEEAGTVPEITVAVAGNTTLVQDNGPGLPGAVIEGVLDYHIRASSKDAYISPTRGAQGNALKTVVAIPYVLSGGISGELSVMSRGDHHHVTITVDRIAQRPEIRHVVTPDGVVRTGTRVTVVWPDSACSELTCLEPRFLQLLDAYHLFNPHATFRVEVGNTRICRERTAQTCTKWIASEPTSPHWYSADRLRALMAAYIAAEREGERARTVREFIAEFRGLSATAKQKAILAKARVSGVHLRDLVRDGDVDHRAVEALRDAMCAESRAVKPAALGTLGEAHCRTWLEAHGGRPQTVRYKRIADTDTSSGLPFVVEVAWAVRTDEHPRRLVTGINFAPTLTDPYRALKGYGLGLDGLLSSLHVYPDDPITIVVHLACPHLNYTDRGKSSLEAV